MKAILVDDEPLALEIFEIMLHKQRKTSCKLTFSLQNAYFYFGI